MSTPEDQLTRQMTLTEFIDAVGDNLGVPKVLRDAIFERETGYSHYDAKGRVKRSPKGALGIGQLMPGTAKRFGVNPNDPIDNAFGALKYQKWLYDRFRASTDSENEAMLLTAAAYNSGEGNVDKYRGIPPFAETQNYVKYVASRIRGAQPFESSGESLPRKLAETQEPLDRPTSTRSGLFAVPEVPGMRGGVAEAGIGGRPASSPSLADLKRYDEQAINQIARGQKVRRAVKAAAPPGFSLLPRDMQEWLGGVIAKGGGGLAEITAGAMRDLPMWTPAMVGQDTKKQADFINQIAQEINEGSMQMDAEAGRGFLSQTTQDVLAGSIVSAPAMALVALGVPAPAAFGLQGYMHARGRDGELKELLWETGKGATIGALFELPIPKKLDLLQTLGTKLGLKPQVGKAGSRAAVVGAGTYGVDVASGAPPEQARTNAAVNALFALTGAAKRGAPEVPGAATYRASRTGIMPEIPEIPVRTISEPRVIKGGGKDYAQRQAQIQRETGQTGEARSGIVSEVAPVSITSEGQSGRVRDSGKEVQGKVVVPEVPRQQVNPVQGEGKIQELEGRIEAARERKRANKWAELPEGKERDAAGEQYGRDWDAEIKANAELYFAKGGRLYSEAEQKAIDAKGSSATLEEKTGYLASQYPELAALYKANQVAPPPAQPETAKPASSVTPEGGGLKGRELFNALEDVKQGRTITAEQEKQLLDGGYIAKGYASKSGVNRLSEKGYFSREDLRDFYKDFPAQPTPKSAPPPQPSGVAPASKPAAPTAPTTTTLDGKSYTRGADGEWRRDSDGKRVHTTTKDRLNESTASRQGGPTEPAAPTPTAVNPAQAAIIQEGAQRSDATTPSPARVPDVPINPLDPDAILERARSLPSREGIPRSSNKAEAGFTTLLNPVEIARGAAEIARNFPAQIKDLAGGIRLRTNEAKTTARNVAREFTRAVAEAQINPKFREVWRGVVTAQEEASGRLFDVREHLHTAWKPLFNVERQRVAELIYQGNEIGRVFNRTELSGMGLGEREITAYQRIRQAQDAALDIRRDQMFAKIDDAVGRVDPEQAAVLETLKQRIGQHYDTLKANGYVSLQRIGDYSVSAVDPKTGSRHYDHAESATDAQRRAREFRQQGLEGVQVKRLEDLPRADYSRMRPEEFEAMVVKSGANPNSLEVQKLRDEVYSRFPSRGYELQRDYTPGYKRTKDALTKSIIRQAEVYSNTYKNSLGRQRAERALLDADVDAGLQRFSQRFIDAETNPAPLTVIGRGAQRARQLVYLKVLAGDIGQFYMNAFAQPLQLTYPYFARPEFGLRGAQPEIYFARGWKLAGQALTHRAPKEFQQLFQQAVKEGAGQAQLTKSLAEAEIESRPWIEKASRIGSAPMQLGERVTRGHVLAEAYLVGKEKLKLRGEALYRFMAESAYATQTRTGAGEAPGVVRMTGEPGRSVYQFQAFQHMYMENLGLSIRADMRANLRKGELPLTTARFVAGTVLTAGIGSLPLSGAALVVTKAIFGEDWKEVFTRLMGDKTVLRDLALYGILAGGQQGASERMNAPLSSVPNVPTVRSEADVMPRVPVLSVAGDVLIRAPRDLYRGDYTRAAEDVAPRVLRGPLRAYRYDQEGIKTRGGSTIASKRELTLKDRLLTIFNVQTEHESKYYEKQRMQRAQKSIRGARQLTRKALRAVPNVPVQTPTP